MKLSHCVLLVPIHSVLASAGHSKHLKGQGRSLKPKSSHWGHSPPSTTGVTTSVKGGGPSRTTNATLPSSPRHRRGLTSYHVEDEELSFFGRCSNICRPWTTSASSSEGEAAPMSVRPPTSIANWKENKHKYCCDGGATFLKVRFEAENDQKGMLTFNGMTATERSTACPVDLDESESDGIGGFEGASPTTPVVRIIPCDDDCVLFPIADGGKPSCSSSLDIVDVESGTEVCFAVVDPSTHQVLYDQKMATDLDVWFIPEGAEDETLWASTIHTSCSTPLVPPYAAAFFDACHDDSEDSLINLDSHSGSTPYLAFVDGMSRTYYEGAVKVGGGEDEESYAQEFDISMAHCCCSCGGSHTPEVTDAPAIEIPEPPFGAPVVSPSVELTESPVASPVTSPTVEDTETPTESSTESPTESPTAMPTASETTLSPTSILTASPSSSPSSSPTGTSGGNPGPGIPPSSLPSDAGTTVAPTLPVITATPNNSPISSPSAPSGGYPFPGYPTTIPPPSASPTVTPTTAPSISETLAPTPLDTTASPSSSPSSSPTGPSGGNPGPGIPPSSLPSDAGTTVAPTLPVITPSPTNSPISSPAAPSGDCPPPGNPTTIPPPSPSSSVTPTSAPSVSETTLAPTLLVITASPSSSLSGSPAAPSEGNPGPGIPPSSLPSDAATVAPTLPVITASPTNSPISSPSAPSGGYPFPGYPTTIPPPSASPTVSPSSSPTGPSGGELSPPLTPPPSGGGCPSTCIDTVLASCVFNDNIPALRQQPCDVNRIIPDGSPPSGGGEDGRFLLSAYEYHMSSIEALEKQLKHLQD